MEPLTGAPPRSLLPSPIPAKPPDSAATGGVSFSFSASPLEAGSKKRVRQDAGPSSTPSAPLNIPDDDCQVELVERAITAVTSESFRAEIHEPWRHALIIKTMGFRHSYGFMLTKLQQKWSPKSHWHLVDLKNGFYIARFSSKEDMDYVLTEGPWLIGGRYLAIQHWKPKFCPAKETINKLAIWIRISKLPVEYMNFRFLRKIGNYIGTTIKVDMNTVRQSRGKFARLCIQVDLDKPLRTSLQVDGIWANLEYEGLNLICFTCGKFGHNKEGCDADKPVSEEIMEDPQPEESLPFGPWMKVPSRINSKNPVNKISQPVTQPKVGETSKLGQTKGAGVSKGGSYGSRFDILEEIMERDQIWEDAAPVAPDRMPLTPIGELPTQSALGGRFKKNKGQGKKTNDARPVEINVPVVSEVMELKKNENRKGKVVSEKIGGNVEFTNMEVSKYVGAFENIKWPNLVATDDYKQNEVEEHNRVPPDPGDNMVMTHVQETPPPEGLMDCERMMDDEGAEASVGPDLY